MKQLVLTIALLLFIFSPSARAQTPSPKQTVEQLAQVVSDAYAAKALGRLDAGRPYIGKVTIVIEHSLADDDAKDRFQRKAFKTLAQGERWLRSRETADGFPARVGRLPGNCKKGACRYDFGAGLLHNHLYLQKITYGYNHGRPYIKTIFLLDGD